MKNVVFRCSISFSEPYVLFPSTWIEVVSASEYFLLKKFLFLVKSLFSCLILNKFVNFSAVFRQIIKTFAKLRHVSNKSYNIFSPIFYIQNENYSFNINNFEKNCQLHDKAKVHANKFQILFHHFFLNFP